MIAAHKGQIPFAILIIPFIAGIACGLNFNFSGHILFLSAILAALAAVFFLLNTGYKYFSIYKHKWLGGILAHLILMLTGWIDVYLSGNSDTDIHTLNENFDDNLLIIGNGNAKGLISKLQREAGQLDIKYADAGRNKSITTESN